MPVRVHAKKHSTAGRIRTRLYAPAVLPQLPLVSPRNPAGSLTEVQHGPGIQTSTPASIRRRSPGTGSVDATASCFDQGAKEEFNDPCEVSAAHDPTLSSFGIAALSCPEHYHRGSAHGFGRSDNLCSPLWNHPIKEKSDTSGSSDDLQKFFSSSMRSLAQPVMQRSVFSGPGDCSDSRLRPELPLCPYAARVYNTRRKSTFHRHLKLLSEPLNTAADDVRLMSARSDNSGRVNVLNLDKDDEDSITVDDICEQNQVESSSRRSLRSSQVDNNSRFSSTNAWSGTSTGEPRATYAGKQPEKQRATGRTCSRPVKQLLFPSPRLPPIPDTIVIGSTKIQLRASKSKLSVVVVPSAHQEQMPNQSMASNADRREGDTSYNKSRTYDALRHAAGENGGACASAPAHPDTPRTPSSPHARKSVSQYNTQSSDAQGPESQYPRAWSDAFHRLKQEKEIHRDDCARALQLAGFAPPTQKWVDASVDATTSYSTLEEEEFLRFVTAYKQLQHDAYAVAFANCDSDGSGQVEAHELADLLQQFGVVPMKHVLKEVIREVDVDGTGTLDLSEFETVMEMILRREGFTKQEYDDCIALIQRFDRDGEGTIDTKELQHILTWLGYAWGQKDVESIVAEVDVDGSGTIDEREFLICMRKVREREVNMISDIMKAHDADGSGEISAGEMVAVLKALGYRLPDPVAVQQSLRDAGIAADDDELDLSEFWRFLQVYRQREGLNTTDYGEIWQAFVFFDKRREGEIRSEDVGKLLRRLGYQTQFEFRQQLIARVDVDGSGTLDVGEVRKMIRMLRDRDIQRIMDAFAEHDTQMQGFLTEPKILDCLQKLELIDANSRTFPAMRAEEMVSATACFRSCQVEGFMSFCLRLAAEGRQAIQLDGGFTATQVSDFRASFEQYDVDRSGDVSKGELVKLLESIFQDSASSKGARPQLVRLIAEIDSDGNGKLDFQEFLRLMGRFRELQEEDQTKKEQLAIRRAGFSPLEVTEFRELFLSHDSGESRLSLEDVTTMIERVLRLGDAYLKQLTDIFYRIIGPDRETADFPEFLQLMSTLVDQNFANIREKPHALAT